jgi:hypothetical protein
LSLSANATLASTPSFQSLVQAGAAVYAQTVSAEDPTTAGHAQRVSFAGAVLRHPMTSASGLSNAVASVAGITGSSADADIIAAIASVWNACAEVS